MTKAVERDVKPQTFHFISFSKQTKINSLREKTLFPIVCYSVMWVILKFDRRKDFIFLSNNVAVYINVHWIIQTNAVVE